MKKKIVNISGPVFSIVTPFLKNGNIDYKSLFKTLKYYYRCNVRIFYLMLYNSRLGLLNDIELYQLNSRIAIYLKKNFTDTLFIGAERFEGSSKETLLRINKLAKFPIDIFSVIMGEKYYNEDQVYSHFKYLNDYSRLPLMLHLQMMMNGHGTKPPVVDYSIRLTNKICSLSNFVAIKEDAKNYDFTIKLIKKIKNKVQIIRAGGGMSAWSEFSKLGCQSWLVGIELLDPRIAFDFKKKLKKNDKKFLKNLYEKIEKPFFEKAAVYGWHIFIKSCLEICGYMKRYERLPLKELNFRHHNEIKKFINQIRKNSKKYFNKEYFTKI